MLSAFKLQDPQIFEEDRADWSTGIVMENEPTRDPRIASTKIRIEMMIVPGPRFDFLGCLAVSLLVGFGFDSPDAAPDICLGSESLEMLPLSSPGFTDFLRKRCLISR